VDGKQIRSRIDVPMDFFDNDYDALINASAYIRAVDRKLRTHGLGEEFVWGD